MNGLAADRPPSIDVRLYRAGLRLCPGEFRGDHGDEMACDFEDARGEAVAAGTAALWQLRLLVGVDLARAIVVQWLRTGLPVIGAIAVCLSLLLVGAVAAAGRFVTNRLAADLVVSDAVGAVLLGSVALMVIVATIVFNLWASRPDRIRRR